ncbi:MAG: hypothetical protein KDC98_19360 [Planctomycetes bacterium]|nr:hypothetical protein [Planctomycetota bacterium]
MSCPNSIPILTLATLVLACTKAPEPSVAPAAPAPDAARDLTLTYFTMRG